MGISGKDGGLLKCEKKLSKGQDIGFVGEITEVNPKIIYDLLEKDFLPIICPIGFDDSCLSYNINADDAACAVAKAVKAEKLAFLTDVEGLYRDFEDKNSLIFEMMVDEAQEFINSGIIRRRYASETAELCGCHQRSILSMEEAWALCL